MASGTKPRPQAQRARHPTPEQTRGHEAQARRAAHQDPPSQGAGRAGCHWSNCACQSRASPSACRPSALPSQNPNCAKPAGATAATCCASTTWTAAAHHRSGRPRRVASCSAGLSDRSAEKQRLADLLRSNPPSRVRSRGPHVTPRNVTNVTDESLDSYFHFIFDFF